MERSEPALVPEWLKTTGSISGGGNANHHSISSSSHSDNHGTHNSARNRSSLSTSDYDSPRSFTQLDRTSSSYFNRSSSSNGSVIHEKESSGFSRSHSSSGRSHRDRDRDSDPFSFCNKDRLVLDNGRDNSLSASNSFTNSHDNEPLWHSRLIISAKRGELWSKQLPSDVNSSNRSNFSNSSSSIVRGTGNSVRTVFEKDFPSLGAEERHGTSDLARTSSPVLSSASQNLPIGTSVVIGGDGWSSALAEVPVIIGSNGMGHSSGHQSTTGNVYSSTMSGLNMAATLAQASPRAQTAPQLSVETQRLEELAIKQSRQLIPMTPSMPKTLALNSDKQKPRATSRSDMSLASKIGHQNQSSLVINHPLSVGNAKPDVAKLSSQFGKLLVLKPARENNGSIPSTKSSMSPASAGAVRSNPLSSAPSPIYSHKNPNNAKLASTEHKASGLPVTRSSPMEKRPSLSQVQSRNDFFNSMRRKTSTNLSAGFPNHCPELSKRVLVKPSESTSKAVNMISQINDAPLLDPSCVDWSRGNRINLASNGGACEEPPACSNNGDEDLVHVEAYSNEEEIAFLRSLGWDENSGEEEGLTEEEIHSFCKEYVKLQPASKLCQQQKLLSLLKTHVGSFDGVSSGVSSSDL